MICFTFLGVFLTLEMGKTLSKELGQLKLKYEGTEGMAASLGAGVKAQATELQQRVDKAEEEKKVLEGRLKVAEPSLTALQRLSTGAKRRPRRRPKLLLLMQSYLL
ncbi:unnamed protein product [Cuscuta epithymum]|uniref:Uncharacterized protein n=1 Tax=Cuscuta epithymum TaxID=186058 RepID=A0AAV0FQC7_9ASTE|nr:unnamed protein product [Cuscuta epithymum]